MPIADNQPPRVFFLPIMDRFLAVITFAVGIALGVWLGNLNKEIEVREEVRYVTREPVRIDTELFPKWSAERIILPPLQYHDTIREVVTIPADTAEIIADYFKERDYDLDFSTDSTGTFKVRAIVSRNRVARASAEIAPVVREVQTTTREVRAFRAYVGGGVSIGKSLGASVEVGALLNDKHLPKFGYQRIGKDNLLYVGYGRTF